MKDYPQAYIDYLVYFNGVRDFFECHEVLEEYWKAHPNSPLSDTWVGLIQIAVGLYHQRRNNMNGALKMLRSARTKLTAERLAELGIDAHRLLDELHDRCEQLTSLELVKFADLDIPLRDERLLEQCMEQCRQMHVNWGQGSDMDDEALIHKHKLRDRSDVIAERTAQLAKRQQARREH